ncbi:DUF3558 domain-containing protein [Saccharomonospora xinjiangensis]|uniref:DUF3558 domain-containing protein n=1 Tax=Saccharomonospora xinjiangensis TaxID=75294 RepID=UPI0005941AB6|nr:DUF3558 domain-containing protein [Saccharomonospora xinjiangensis]
MRDLVKRIVPMVLVVILAISCSASDDGFARSTENKSIVVSSSNHPQRRVSEPLEISPYLSRPCDLVSSQLLGKLGTSPDKSNPRLPKDDEVAAGVGPSCSWKIEGEGSIGIGIASENARRGAGGLRALELLREQGRFKLWEESSVSAYPAVYFGVRDARTEGDCDLAVGIADDMTFSVAAIGFSSGDQQACDVADEIAADVIANLRKGS